MVAAPMTRFTGRSADLGDGGDPADAANERALAHAALAAVVPEQVEDIAELVVGEQPPRERAELDGALGQGVIGEHRGVEVPEEALGDLERQQVRCERIARACGPRRRR